MQDYGDFARIAPAGGRPRSRFSAWRMSPSRYTMTPRALESCSPESRSPGYAAPEEGALRFANSCRRELCNLVARRMGRLLHLQAAPSG